jgi:hypothetical protein
MTNNLLEIDNSIDIDDSDCGKSYLFWRQDRSDDTIFSFSSVLENIGYLEKHDRSLRNKTKVLVLGDPIEEYHKTMGLMNVSKILYNGIMYVSSHCLHPIDE